MHLVDVNVSANSMHYFSIMALWIMLYIQKFGNCNANPNYDLCLSLRIRLSS